MSTLIHLLYAAFTDGQLKKYILACVFSQNTGNTNFLTEISFSKRFLIFIDAL